MAKKQFDPAVAAVTGTFWTSISYLSGKLMLFVSTVVLARLLTQQDFGVAAYAVIVIALLDVFSDLGVNLAVIYHKESRSIANAAFWLGLLIATILFLLTWFLAPLAADFFNDARAVPVIRALALTFPLSALSNIHDALIRKRLSFGRKLIPDLIRMTSKGGISILLAVLGFGPWSLIYGQLAGTAMAVVAFWWILPWRPSFHFERTSVRPLFSYGSGIVMVSLIGMLVNYIDYMLIGRFLGAAMLGVYMLAFRLPELLIGQLSTITGKVLFPLYTMLREEKQQLSSGVIRTLQYVLLLTLPMGFGLAILSGPFVLVIFSERWSDAISVLPATALYVTIRSFTFNIGDFYKAQGRLSLMTVLALVHLAILAPALYMVVTTFKSLSLVGWTVCAVAFVIAATKLIVATKVLHLPARNVVSAFHPAAGATLAMSVCIGATLLLFREFSPLVQLIVCSSIGSVVYIAAVWWLQRDVVLAAKNTLRKAMLGLRPEVQLL